jgi:hypothetical protein
MVRKSRLVLVVFAALVATAIVALPAFADPPLPGAIFTTDSECIGTNLNIYDDKGDVYLDGGPSHPGAAGLPDGSYFVQVTEPEGTALGKSSVAAVTVSGGEFTQCYQLSSILNTASSGFTTAGYDDTSNPGGEYKVWVSSVSTFDNNSTKTDNFKVKAGGGENQATLDVVKFYDANANGINDDSQPITGWRVHIQDGIDFIRYTPVEITVDPGDYTVTESDTVETNWVHTTDNPLNLTLNAGDKKKVEFGNLCTGAGGGKTLGFWSNKNGEATINDGGTMGSELDLLKGLNLRNAEGSEFNPATYAALRTWLLNGTATNMANMLSVQLAAMELNVEGGLVNGNALIYAPGATNANALGFATVNSVMTDANNDLGLDGETLSGDPNRSHQEALKNALDNANDNLNFVQSSPCKYTFPN